MQFGSGSDEAMLFLDRPCTLGLDAFVLNDLADTLV